MSPHSLILSLLCRVFHLPPWKTCPSWRLQYKSIPARLSLCHWTYQHYIIIPSFLSCKSFHKGNRPFSHTYWLCVYPDTKLVNSSSILPPSSDHNSILTLSPPSIRLLQCNVRLYSRANFDAINTAISSMDFQVDVNSAWNQFHNTFLSVLSNHIPNKILSTCKSLPWVTYCLQLQLRKWEQAYNKAKRPNSPTRMRNKRVAMPHSRKRTFLKNLSTNLRSLRQF